MNSKTKIYKQKTFDETLVALRKFGFELIDAPGTQTGRTFLKKYGCSAAIERGDDGHPRIYGFPGVIVGNEISKLVDHGYQKFLETSKIQRAATAEDLRSLHSFTEELKEAMGIVSLYNESMGTVSESYVYDRVKGREGDRAPRPWDKLGKRGA